MTDNERRVRNGRRALKAHPTAADGEPDRTVLIDLLTDLHHLARRDGLDWEACVRMADDHFHSEVLDVAQG